MKYRIYWRRGGETKYDDLPGRFFAEAYSIWLKSAREAMWYSKTLLNGKPHLTVIPSKENPPTHPSPWCFVCGRVGYHSDSECLSFLDEDIVDSIHDT